MHDFEREVETIMRESARQVIEHTVGAIEPEEGRELPARVEVDGQTYRRNRPTPNRIATLFGSVALTRCVYQPTERGAKCLSPLEHALGIVAGLATPALADEAARLNAELPQAQTRDVLARRHHVHWADGTLRKLVARVAENCAPQRHAAQVARLAELLKKAQKSRGKHRPTLCAGRDGVMIPMRPCWEEAACATVSVHDRAGQRLGTVYLGQMPEFGQAALTGDLEQLLRDTLRAHRRDVPRLSYLTDAGSHPQEFYKQSLRPMKHPRTDQPLRWSWTVDYFHAAQRVTTLAEALFGEGREGAAWAEKLRRVLRDKPQGATRVVQRAKASRRAHGLIGAKKKFDEACRYLKKYAPHMRYAELRRQKLPIGSGVTEAGCKLIFTQRFKQSGMRWHREQGQHVLDLRVILKSGVWDTVRTANLNRYCPCQPATPALTPGNPRKKPEKHALRA
jgi:hypothetical protein